MIHTLLHSNLTKEEGIYYLTVRTQEAKDFLEQRASEKGLKAVITLKAPLPYLGTDTHVLEHWKEKNDFLGDFISGLGLKII